MRENPDKTQLTFSPLSDPCSTLFPYRPCSAHFSRPFRISFALFSTCSIPFTSFLWLLPLSFLPIHFHSNPLSTKLNCGNFLRLKIALALSIADLQID